MRLRRGEAKTRSSSRQVRRSQRERSSSVVCPVPGPPLLRAIEEALARIKQGTFGVCQICKLPVSKARLEVVPWTRLCRECKEASTPPLDTQNIGFESPMEIGYYPRIVPVGFGRTPFAQTVNCPQHKIARAYSSCRQLHDNGKGGIFCFSQFC